MLKAKVASIFVRGGTDSISDCGPGSSLPAEDPPLGAPHALLTHSFADRLTAQEWRRRLVHMSPGLLPFVLVCVPHPDPLPWYTQAVILAVSLGFAFFALKRAGLFLRQDEHGWTKSVVSYLVITLMMFLGFPAQPEMGMAVTIIIAFGDGAATLAGMLSRGRRLPWNSDKSWVGMGAFIVCSIPPAALVYWAEARPAVSSSVALACVVPAALAAALVESVQTQINDNIRVGATAGLVILMAQQVFVGQ